MGILEKKIKKNVQDEILSNGLVFWIDPEEIYSLIVEEWILDHSFGFPIFTYRGSFLELMVESRAVLSTHQKPKCLIYVPRILEKDLSKTPLFETFKASKKFYLELIEFLKKVSVGQLTEAQANHLLNMEGLSLEKAEEFFGNRKELPREILPLLKEYGEIGLVIYFLKSPNETLDRLHLPHSKGFPVFLEYLNSLIGLDVYWTINWRNTEETTYTSFEQLEIVFSYLTCMEYVHDLKKKPNSDRLIHLLSKSKEYLQKVHQILNEVRSGNKELTIKLSDQVQQKLYEQEMQFDIDDLGQIDTFRFEADRFLETSMELLKSKEWEKVLHYSTERIPTEDSAKQYSFWLENDTSRMLLWRWIQVAAKLGMKSKLVYTQILQFKEKINFTLEDLTESYTSHFYQLDSLHRMFAVHTEFLQSGVQTGSYLRDFSEIRSLIRKEYRTTVDLMSNFWNEICLKSGFLPSREKQQRNFLKNWILPLTTKDKKVAVIFADALRYELGIELFEKMKNNLSGKISIDYLFAELPTKTSVGMNALVSMTDTDNKLKPLLSNTYEFLGFESGQRKIYSPADRKKALEDHIGFTIDWTNLDEYKRKSGKETKNSSQNKLKVIAALDIDAMGENNALRYGNDYFQNGISAIFDGIQKLQNDGFEEILITSDHGFLIGDETVVSNFAPNIGEESISRRYAIDSVERQVDQLCSVPLNQLDYSSQSEFNYIVFPRGTQILTAYRDKHFYHDGNSIQERIVPVLHWSLSSHGIQQKGRFTFEIQKVDDILSYHRIKGRISPEDSRLFVIESIQIKLIVDEGNQIQILDTRSETTIGEYYTVNIDREFEILFKVLGNESRSKIKLVSADPDIQLTGNQIDNYFSVTNLPISRVPVSQESKELRISTQIPTDFHEALKHLYKHKSITEEVLVQKINLPNSERLARVFSKNLITYMKYLDFQIEVHQIPGRGKEYKVVL